MKNKKTLFVLNIDNQIDLITNSSSELFVIQCDSKNQIDGLIKSVYPDYRNEYENPELLSEMSNHDINSYIDWIEHTWSLSKEEAERSLYPGISFDEMFKKQDYSWKKEDCYELSDDFPNDQNREKVLDYIDPNRNTYLLYSIDENPDWDMQKELMSIGQRYHLG